MKKVLVIGDEIKVQKVPENLQELHTANYNDNSIYYVNNPIYVFTKLYQSSEFSRLPDMFYKYAEIANVTESKDFKSLITNYTVDVEIIVDKNSVVGEIVQHYIDNSNESKVKKLNDEISSLKMTNVGLNEHIKRLKVGNKEAELELQILEDEKEVFRNSYNAIIETPTLKVIFELIKVWWVNKFTLK